MKTELRLLPHALVPGERVIELWHDGQFVGTVTGADGPGVITKHPMIVVKADMVTEVRIEP
jgi:hypothetical protein